MYGSASGRGETPPGDLPGAGIRTSCRRGAFACRMEGPRAEVRVGTSPGTRRLIEFGRHADEHRNERGEGKPEVFNFLRFTHTCWRTRKTGRFIVKRKTIPKR